VVIKARLARAHAVALLPVAGDCDQPQGRRAEPLAQLPRSCSRFAFLHDGSLEERRRRTPAGHGQRLLSSSRTLRELFSVNTCRMPSSEIVLFLRR
jgi:hypothetical protein